MLTPANDRAAARFLWQQMLQSDEEWLRQNARAPPAAARRARSDRSARSRSSSAIPRPPGEPVTWEALMRRSPASRDSDRSDGHAVRARSGDRDASRVSKTSPLSPMPDLDTASLMTCRRDRAWSRMAVLGLAVGSFLNVCIHRLPREVRSSSRLELPALRLRAALVRQHPGPQLRAARRALPEVQGRDLDPLSDRRDRDDGDLRRCTTWCSGPTSSWCRGCSLRAR